MTSSAVGTHSAEFVGVVRLANYYASVHFKTDQIVFIDKVFWADKETAQATAKRFSERMSIPYDINVGASSQPIITVVKMNEKWIPAELHPDKVILLVPNDSSNLGSNQEEVIKLANGIASIKKSYFIPSFDGFTKVENKSCS